MTWPTSKSDFASRSLSACEAELNDFATPLLTASRRMNFTALGFGVSSISLIFGIAQNLQLCNRTQSNSFLIKGYCDLFHSSDEIIPRLYCSRMPWPRLAMSFFEFLLCVASALSATLRE